MQRMPNHPKPARYAPGTEPLASRLQTEGSRRSDEFHGGANEDLMREMQVNNAQFTPRTASRANWLSEEDDLRERAIHQSE